MVRLVFRPYTQVRRTVWTSVWLRASTRVSSCFAPLRHTQVRLALTSDSSVLFSRLVDLGACQPSPGTRGSHEGHRRGRAPCVTWSPFTPSPRQNASPGLTPPAWPAIVRAPSRAAISFRHSASSWGALPAPMRLLPRISSTLWISFQSPFHLSLAVLVRYRSPRPSSLSFSLTLAVPRGRSCAGRRGDQGAGTPRRLRVARWIVRSCVCRPSRMRNAQLTQWIVAARPLCHLQCPVAYLSRLQRIQLVARQE